MSCIRGHDVVIVHFYSMKFKNPRFKMARAKKVGVASRGGGTAAAAAAAAAAEGEAAEVGSEHGTSNDEDPPSKKNSVKDKSAIDAALEEVAALNHEAGASASPARAKNQTKASTNGAKGSAPPPEQADATSDRVKELERQKKQREAAEAQAAAIQKLEAENLRLKRKLQLEQKAESIPRKAPKKRRSSAERRENLVNAVFAMWVLSVIV